MFIRDTFYGDDYIEQLHIVMWHTNPFWSFAVILSGDNVTGLTNMRGDVRHV